MRGGRKCNAICSAINTSNVFHYSQLALIEHDRWCRNVGDRSGAKIPHGLVNAADYRAILPSFNRLVDQRHAVPCKHVPVRNIYKLQKLHRRYSRIPSLTALVKDSLGNCTRISTHRFALLVNQLDIKMRRESAEVKADCQFFLDTRSIARSCGKLYQITVCTSSTNIDPPL
ncbi:hypothetical protein AXG94_19000 [Pseudomonas corrugata]|nr:hypothetical protein AXG94_19000 [Pseudomonas corrugata]